MTKPIKELRNAHADQTAWIIGKGPSIMDLTVDMIGHGPIIALNQAIRKISALGLGNTTYSLQKDGAWGYLHDRGECPFKCTELVDEQCKLFRTAPKNGQILLVHRYHSFCCFPSYEPRYMFDCADWGLQPDTPSNIFALKIAALLGCRNLVMVAFDGVVCRDRRVVENGLYGLDRGTDGYVVDQPGYFRVHGSSFDNIFWLSPGRTPHDPSWIPYWRNPHPEKVEKIPIPKEWKG